MSTFATINHLDEIPAAIARMQVAGAGHRVPLLQAVYHGRIAHLEMQRTTSASLIKRWMTLACLPSLLLVGDDDYASADGPYTWPQAQRVLRWARGVVIHGGRGEPEHYQAAIAFAESVDRVVLVECSSSTVGAWHEAADRWARVRRMTFAPETGCVHPVQSKEAAQ